MHGIANPWSLYPFLKISWQTAIRIFFTKCSIFDIGTYVYLKKEYAVKAFFRLEFILDPDIQW